MTIWSAEIKELEKLYESIKGQLPDLEKELERLIKADDENMILLYSRRCLEVIINDLCECELKRERGTEPLKGVIDKLNKDKKIPAHIASSMYGLNELSAYGAHPKDYDPEQVKPVLINLDIIIKWYLKNKQLATIGRTEVQEETIKLRREHLEEVTIRERTEVQEKPAKAGERKLISIVAISALLVIAAIIVYPKIFKEDTLEKLRSSEGKISVAVMPFQNMTNDTTKNIWQEMIQDNLIAYISNSEELKVRQAESIITLLQSNNITNYASITPSAARSLSQKLDANVYIQGSINQTGILIRLNAKLIDSKSEEVFKSFSIDGTAENIFTLIDSLSLMVGNYLLITKLERENIEFAKLATTNSPQAYRYYVYGKNAYYQGQGGLAVREWCEKALAIDSNFVLPMKFIITAYDNMGNMKEARKWTLKLYSKKDIMNEYQRLAADYLYADHFMTPNDAIFYLKQLQQIDDQPPVRWSLGLRYFDMTQYDKAINEFEKVLETYNKWGSKPLSGNYYLRTAQAYIKTGQYKKAKGLLDKAEKDFPVNNVGWRTQLQAIISLVEGDMVAVNKYTEKYKSINSLSEARLNEGLASIYYEAGILDKAEEYHRQALSFEPENPVLIDNLGYFLINTDRNIKEGLELADRALGIEPDNYAYLHSKGWGLFKQGNYNEALEILQKSWDLRRQYAVLYYHEPFLHLEAAKKAVANQNKN